jgi:hypothetical protein
MSRATIPEWYSPLRAIVTDVEKTTKLLREVDDVQWHRGVRRRSVGARVRSKGEVSDPTASTALDPQRLELRRHRKQALRQLDVAATAMAAARFHLEEGLATWSG